MLVEIKCNECHDDHGCRQIFTVKSGKFVDIFTEIVNHGYTCAIRRVAMRNREISLQRRLEWWAYDIARSEVTPKKLAAHVGTYKCPYSYTDLEWIDAAYYVASALWEATCSALYSSNLWTVDYIKDMIRKHCGKKPPPLEIMAAELVDQMAILRIIER